MYLDDTQLMVPPHDMPHARCRGEGFSPLFPEVCRVHAASGVTVETGHDEINWHVFSLMMKLFCDVGDVTVCYGWP